MTAFADVFFPLRRPFLPLIDRRRHHERSWVPVAWDALPKPYIKQDVGNYYDQSEQSERSSLATFFQVSGVLVLRSATSRQGGSLIKMILNTPVNPFASQLHSPVTVMHFRCFDTPKNPC